MKDKELKKRLDEIEHSSLIMFTFLIALLVSAIGLFSSDITMKLLMAFFTTIFLYILLKMVKKW